MLLASLTLRLQSEPSNPSLYLDRARVYLSLNDKAKALDDLDQAIDLDPQMAEALMIRGKLRFELHDKNSAFDDLQKAASLEPGLLASLSGEYKTPNAVKPFKVKL